MPLPSARRDHTLKRTVTRSSTTVEQSGRMATGGAWPPYVCGALVRDESGCFVARAPAIASERAQRTYQSEDVRAAFKLVCPGHPNPRADGKGFVSACCARAARFPWVRDHAAVCASVLKLGNAYAQSRKTHILTSVMHMCTMLGEHDLAERYGRAVSAPAPRKGADVTARDARAHR